MAKKKSNDNVAKINLGKVVPSPIPDSDIDLILAGETPVGNLNALNTHGLKYYHDNSGGDEVTPINKGGTGATTVAGARNNLGLGNTSGAVPIANGGTGATNATSARTNLGLQNIERIDYLWTNASPSSAFAAQTVSLDLSNYDAIEVYFANKSAQHVMDLGSTVRVAKRDTGLMFLASHGPDVINNFDRSVKAADNGVQFGDGIISYPASTTHSDLVVVPIDIYGIKILNKTY